jgi:CheY-like chemotaxis protein
MPQAPEKAAPRVLVVDDNEDMRRSMALLLGRAGYQVDTAPNGAQALERHRVQAADVLITDLLMPEKDGIETIAQFRRDYPAVKIIAMSGGGMRVKGERYLATAEVVGADAVLRKPFEMKKMLETLAALLSGKK